MKLSELVFSDLCVADSATSSWFKATPDSLLTQEIPQACAAELAQLRNVLMARAGTSDFRVDWPNKESADCLGMRVERLAVSHGQTVFICRRFRILPGPLATLGMPSTVAQKLLAATLTEGLVVFFGKTGSGKSTTAASFGCERLHKFGGVMWTVENPIELPMQGRHGAGVCYQTEVGSDEDIGSAICRLYRATPNIILIGELRDGLAVREALAASTSGHLVLTTFHAPDLITGLARLTRLAGDKSAISLADALRVALHLELHHAEAKAPLPGTVLRMPEAKGTGTPPRVLCVEPLWIAGENADALKANLREGEFHLLKSEVERQRRGFMMSKLP